jgi:hypothetical protein
MIKVKKKYEAVLLIVFQFKNLTLLLRLEFLFHISPGSQYFRSLEIC